MTKELNFIASDGENVTKKTITIKVIENKAPIINDILLKNTVGPDNLYYEGDTIKLQVDAEDPEGEKLKYKILNTNEESSSKFVFYSAEKSFVWDAPGGSAGEYSYTIVVSDSKNSTSKPITFTINETNTPPQFVNLVDDEMKKVTQGNLLEFPVDVKDPDGDEVSLTVLGDLKEHFDSDKRIFSWRPLQWEDKEHSITFKVSDGTEYTKITIPINVNAVPVINDIEDKVVNQ